MLLILLLLIPVATAAASYFARRRTVMEAVNLAGFGAIFFASVVLGTRVLADGTVSLANGFFYADALSALVILLTASVALICASYSIATCAMTSRAGNWATTPAARSSLRSFACTTR